MPYEIDMSARYRLIKRDDRTMRRSLVSRNRRNNRMPLAWLKTGWMYLFALGARGETLQGSRRREGAPAAPAPQESGPDAETGLEKFRTRGPGRERAVRDRREEVDDERSVKVVHDDAPLVSDPRAALVSRQLVVQEELEHDVADKDLRGGVVAGGGVVADGESRRDDRTIGRRRRAKFTNMLTPKSAQKWPILPSSWTKPTSAGVTTAV